METRPECGRLAGVLVCSFGLCDDQAWHVMPSIDLVWQPR